LGAVVGSMIGMLVYIWIRFEFQWGLAAVIALIHDTIITLGLFSLFRFEMSLPVVAAFLTLVGYSVNDTVVIFDRIRENLRAKGGMVASLPELINTSMNQTLSRTILTSLLTWIVCVFLFALGGPALRDFSFVMVIGIIVGTYSSIYIASPFLVVWQEWLGERAKKKMGSEQPKAVAKKVRTGKA
jgi:preprotein translocase subunit SecF